MTIDGLTIDEKLQDLSHEEAIKRLQAMLDYVKIGEKIDESKQDIAAIIYGVCVYNG